MKPTSPSILLIKFPSDILNRVYKFNLFHLFCEAPQLPCSGPKGLQKANESVGFAGG